MATSSEIKQRAKALAEKTDVNSITPREVGGIMYDLASHSENVLRNGGTLGIRKVYESVAAMEADSTNPKDLWGEPLKKGNLVVIYDGTSTGVDNNKIYAFLKPGWQIATHLDAGYATKAGTDAKLAELGSEVSVLKEAVFGTTCKVSIDSTTIGTDNVFFPLSSGIRLVSGESYTFDVDLDNTETLTAYLWDGSTFLTNGVSVKTGVTSVTFTALKDGIASRMSLRGTNTIRVNGGMYYNGEASVASKNDILSVIKKLTVKYNTNSGYYNTSGSVISDNNYIHTSLLPCIPDKKYYTPLAFRYTFFNEKKEFVSSMDGGSDITIPSNAYYVAITYKANNWNREDFYFYSEDLNDAIVFKQELEDRLEGISGIYKKEISNNLFNEESDELEVVSGQYGNIGAVYRVPLGCDSGRYVIGFDFKLPSDFNRSEDVVSLCNFDGLSQYNYFDGIFKINLQKGITSNDCQQLVSNGKIITYINNQTSYRYEWVSNKNSNGMLFGSIAFSLRYLGENEGLTATINDVGLIIKDNGISIVSIPFPDSLSLVDFAKSIKDSCENGELSGMVECAIYDVFGKNTNELVRVEDIPLRYEYSYGMDNMPIFFRNEDDRWHRIEVVFDKSGKNPKELLNVFVDGSDAYYCTGGSFALRGDGVFNNFFTFGCDGVEVRNFTYKNNSTEVSFPRIVVEMLHNIKDDVSSGGQENISVQEIEKIINTYNRNGYKHIGLDEVSNYLNGNVALKGKYYSIVHDDYFHAAGDGKGKNLLNLYKRYGIRATFALINRLLTEGACEEYKKNSNLFLYALHHETKFDSVPYHELLRIINDSSEELANRIGTSTNLVIYPNGAENLSVRHILNMNGFSYGGDVSGDDSTSLANDKMSAPRMSRGTGGYDNLQNEIDAAAKYYPLK